tara:strand:- start:64 stop:306 length:243 start_codon:yes stop_codon:yes gene_type:complete
LQDEVKKMDSGVFVKIDDYKDVVDVIGLIKEKLSHAKATIGKIRDLKSREDSELGEWSSKLEEIEGKISDMDAVLIRSEG